MQRTVEDLDVQKKEFIYAEHRLGFCGWEKMLAATDLILISGGFLYN